MAKLKPFTCAIRVDDALGWKLKKGETLEKALYAEATKDAEANGFDLSQREFKEICVEDGDFLISLEN